MFQIGRIATLFFVSAVMLGCEKIPERGFIDLSVISVGGVAYNTNQMAVVPYGEETEIVFDYSSDAPLDSAFIQLVESHALRINSSDSERIQNEPQQGDLNGQFIYVVDAEMQFDEPVSNPIFNRKFIKVVLMNELGMVEDFLLTVEVQ